IRLTHKRFDWKNHLKADVAQLFHRTSALRKLLIGRRVQIYNVYFSNLTPVDGWEELKGPLQWQQNKSYQMHVFYMTKENMTDEWDRLNGLLNISFKPEAIPIVTPPQLQVTIAKYETELIQKLQEKRMQIRQIFSFGKPLFIYILIGLNVLMYLFLE